jgi:hypothetical protein
LVEKAGTGGAVLGSSAWTAVVKSVAAATGMNNFIESLIRDFLQRSKTDDWNFRAHKLLRAGKVGKLIPLLL